MKTTAIFLDVDGVLNQYRAHERIKRYKKYKRNNFKKEYNCFNPYPKKVTRLARLIKKYNIDVFVFSAWKLEKLQPHLPFKLKGDTNKLISNVNLISLNYDYSIVIDDEISVILKKGCKGQNIRINSYIHTYQPNGDYGLVKQDFAKLKNLIYKGK